MPATTDTATILLHPGQVHRAHYTVTAAHLVPAMVRDVGERTELQHGEPVLATGMLVVWLEDACWQLLRDARAVPAGHTRVGVTLECFTHRSPARLGDQVEVEAQCVRHDPRRGAVEFRVSAVDLDTGCRLVDPVRHELRIVEQARWRARFGIDDGRIRAGLG
ncbi:thioesterase family protein [Saccharopolyspora griseoalba]|uniref:Thioesterase family protein n=1 Tax=Saccharopolyspora griseoalba TaxID=1431848 RepID=A0ABW2LT68_9PSEU